jgi:class 3 adenylate cyclase
MRCRHCASVVPPGMHFCGMCGRSLASSGPGSERERRRVSVVFVDLMGFSTLTHGLDPEVLRDLADEVLTVVAGVVDDYDGYVDAFRGDGLIAVFGAPHSHADDPFRAVVAAAAALRAIEVIGTNRGLDLRGRAGVTTGMVVAGSVGSGRVREYTVMGSVVNLASRLETAARAGQVLVGRDTYEATRHRLSYTRVDGLRLAGFPTVTSAYAYAANRERLHDPYERLPFVGREAELAALGAALDRVRQRGQGERLWLVAEAGAGKTRLVREFANRSDPADTSVLWLSTIHRDDHANGGPDWDSLAAQVLGVRASDDERTRSQQARAALQRLLPDDARWQRLVLGTIGLVPPPTWTRLERRAVDRAMLAWRDLLIAYARERPGRALLIACSGERHAPRFDQFTTLLAEADAPFLVVHTSRGRNLPESAPRLTLEPLSTEESLRLLGQVVDPVFGLAARSLVEQVGGVPASIFELARALTITQDTNVSSSLVSLLQARLDTFDPGPRRLLSVAALAGECCWVGLLTALVPDASAHLALLRSADVLVQDADCGMADEVGYRFRSELLRRAVLQMIPFADRPGLHLRIATWLEQHAPLAFSETIAVHFEKGGASEAAYAHYLAAAGEALVEGDRGRAERFYQALERLDVDPDMRAQAALAHAEAALGWQSPEIASGELARAERAIADCHPEAAERLRLALGRLLRELDAAQPDFAVPG